MLSPLFAMIERKGDEVQRLEAMLNDYATCTKMKKFAEDDHREACRWLAELEIDQRLFLTIVTKTLLLRFESSVRPDLSFI